MTITEAARSMGLSKRSACKMIEAGELDVTITPEQFEACLAAHRVDAPGDNVGRLHGRLRLELLIVGDRFQSWLEDRRIRREAARA